MYWLSICAFDCPPDTVIRPAAAQVVFQPCANLGIGRVRIPIEQSRGSDDYARRAKAALYHLLVDKGALDRMEVLRRPQAFYGRDLTTLDGSDRRATREPNIAIDKDAARAALAQAAPGFGAFESQVVAQDVEQGCIRFDLNAMDTAVDG